MQAHIHCTIAVLAGTYSVCPLLRVHVRSDLSKLFYMYTTIFAITKLHVGIYFLSGLVYFLGPTESKQANTVYCTIHAIQLHEGHLLSIHVLLTFTFKDCIIIMIMGHLLGIHLSLGSHLEGTATVLSVLTHDRVSVWNRRVVL